MSQASPFRLTSVSVVITAQSHNPSILTKEFLTESGIVPDAWQVTETVNTPVLSLVHFEGGVQWAMDSSRLTITESCGASFQDSYQVHKSAIEYLRKIEYVPYRSLGLNCIVHLDSGDPNAWLRERFLKDGRWQAHVPKLVSMIPRFTFDLSSAILNLAFGDQGTSQNRRVVSVDCNVHHEGPLNAAELRDAIAQWGDHQEVLIDTLNMLAGSHLK